MGEPGQSGDAPVGVDEIAALALTGYGHFTTMRVQDGAVRGLGLHLERLARDCRTLFGTELDTDAVLDDLYAAVGDAPGTVVARLTVFDPALGVAYPAATARPRVLVTTRPAPALPPAPQRVRPVPYVRQVAAVKHVGLFESLYLRRAAQLDGWDDVLFTSADGRISEGATWNAGFFDGSRVIWPLADQLPGVTQALLEREYGPSVTRPVTLAELPGMQAAFATNSAVGVRPLTAVGPVPFPSEHPVLTELTERYAQIAADPLR